MPQVYVFILIRLTQHVSGIIMPIIRRTDYVNNCMWNMPGCVGCSHVGWDTSCVHCVKVGVHRKEFVNHVGHLPRNKSSIIYIDGT